MGHGTEDTGAYNRMTRSLPIQPSRCTGVMTFHEQPTYDQFLKSVKKIIRTCVVEGRENELLDHNQSLISAWNEMMMQPVSMNLAAGRKIDLIPRYTWEPTPGYPFWRTTDITFQVQHKKTAPPIPQAVPPPPRPVPPPPPPPIPPPDPIDPCSRGTQDCQPTPTPPPPPPSSEFDYYYYCSAAGVRSLKVPKGKTPPPQADALSGFYVDEVYARTQCFKFNKNQTDDVPIDQKKKKKKDSTNDKDDGDSHSLLSHLPKLSTLFLLFGAVVFLEEDFFFESLSEVFELQNMLEGFYPGELFEFELQTNRITKKLSVNLVRNGVSQDLIQFIEQRYQRGGFLTVKEYEQLSSLANDVIVKMQDLDGARSRHFARKRGTWVRGNFIEDFYIEKVLERQGFVGLPDWFQGYDAYKQGARFSVSRKGGKFVTTFVDPDLISIKSHEPAGGLKNIKLDQLDKMMDGWLKKWIRAFLKKRISR